jgi:1-hydroxycarotenoid 3,4-desaturase
MHRLAAALADLAAERGARFRYRSEVTRILVDDQGVAGVDLATGERVAADAVIVNADVGAISSGRFGATIACTVPPSPLATRSLSAVTWALLAKADGFPLTRHNVFFSDDYAAEFDTIFRGRQVPEHPTVYVCAQDRAASDGPAPVGPERLFCLVNAPPTGDSHALSQEEIRRCEEQAFGQLERCGLKIEASPERVIVTTPADFERLYPATGGALYGQASHGWTASFTRPRARTGIPRLYLAGGSTHPGPGVPMAALSGRLAAASLLSDLASRAPSRKTVISGGTWMV